MKYIVLIFSLLLSLPSCCSSQYREKTPTDISDQAAHVDTLIRETVSLDLWRNEDGDQVSPGTDGAKMGPYCAGVWVSKTTFLTANHCVEDLRPEGSKDEDQLYKLLGETPPGSPIGATVYYSIRSDVSDEPIELRLYHTGKVLATDEDHDLALVRDDSQAVPMHPFAKLASDLKVGEDLDIIGMPAGSWWSYTKGYCSNILAKAHAPNGQEMKMIQVQAPIFYGNSGGPAFNAAGQLVGISSMLSTRVPDRGFYVHLDALDAFLQKNADDK